MNILDAVIVFVPLLLILGMGWYVKRYIRGVADFLSAGRICGRYVLLVSNIAEALSIIGLIAFVEVHYKTGFALAFWSQFMLPLTVLMSLTGYCTYRFRETKAMSLGQFLEMRYSRKFRIFAAALRSFSEMLANMIMPALAARFFIYILDLPHKISIFGFEIETFIILVFVILSMAVYIIWMGGTLALVITDSLQGMILCPIMAFFAIFILLKFSWNGEIVPVMMERAAGESFLNPFDISKLRDFNYFFLLVTIIAAVMHKASWLGGGSSTSARSPHEQKMAGVLSSWRGAITSVFYVLVAVSVLTIMNHRNFAVEAKQIRDNLTDHIAREIMPDLKEQINANVRHLPPQEYSPGQDQPLSDSDNLDTRYMEHVHKSLEKKENGNSLFQQFRTLYYQLTCAVSMRKLLPAGIFGLFLLLLILAMLSTDDSRIFSAAITITQDVIMPLRKKELSPERHIQTVRWVAVFVGVFFLIGSYFMKQLDYINLFVTIMCTMWLGGCGPVMLFGLYSRFGTTAGAWTSLLTGMGLSLAGIFVQRNWADLVYPWLNRNGWADGVGHFLEAVSAPFNPYIVWKMDPIKFPINSYEIYFITMMTTLILYCTVSWATCRKPFNLDRMLHRGKYNLDGENKTREPWSLRNILSKLVGITPEYTRGDKAIAWGFFFYSFGYLFFGTFILVILWNTLAPWPIQWWSHYFLVVSLIVPGIIAAITAVWFGIGGIHDIIQMFRDLNHRIINPLDNGSVSGNMSLADKSELEKIDSQSNGDPMPQKQQKN